MQRTATKWLNALKGHGRNCRCPEKTIRLLKSEIIGLWTEPHEQATLFAMLLSPDKENHVVLISILQEKAPYLFIPEPILVKIS